MSTIEKYGNEIDFIAFYIRRFRRTTYANISGIEKILMRQLFLLKTLIELDLRQNLLAASRFVIVLSDLANRR
jgi:hypothetical protein